MVFESHVHLCKSQYQSTESMNHYSPEGMARTGLIGPMQSAIPSQCYNPQGWPHLFSNSVQEQIRESCETGPTVYTSLSEKTRMSYHLQMSLQRQHILLSYFKTLSTAGRSSVTELTGRRFNARPQSRAILHICPLPNCIFILSRCVQVIKA